MTQGKLEVVKQEMARVNVDILGISELKWTGMGEFNSDDHYIYYYGQESIRRNGVAIIVNKRVQNAVLGCNLKNDRMISVHFQGKPFNTTIESAVTQSCPTLCDPMDCGRQHSSVHGIFQARVLEWVAISFSRGSSQPRGQTWVSRIVGRRFTIWATREVHNIAITQVYAPTSNAEKAEVEQFYEDLQDLLELASKKYVLFIIGDWNAKVGNQQTPGVTGKFGLGVRNEAGQRLMEFCQENTLVIANTLFQ